MPEYLSPSIGQIIPQLDQLCAELTRKALIHALTDYTKELCENDPELADILLDGKKTLPRCIRYVTEQAEKAASKQAETLTAKEMNQLSHTRIHGRDASVMGIAVSDQEVYEWTKAYYYGGDEVEPSDSVTSISAKSKAKKEKGTTKNDNVDKEKKTVTAGESKHEEKPVAAKSSQLSLFGDAA